MLEPSGLLQAEKAIKQTMALAGCLRMLSAAMGPQSALAQRTSQVQFSPGNYGTMVSGTVIGREYIDYKLTASQGQKMFAKLAVSGTNGNGSAYFNILPPGSKGEAIYIGHNDDDNSALVTLPANGT